MMTKRFSGTAPEADEYRLFTLRNASDMVATITERDAALWSWRAPDRYGRMADVLLAPKGAASPVLWQGRHADGGVTLLRTGAGGAVAQLAKYRLDDDGCLSVEHEVVAMASTTLELGACPAFNLNGGIADVGDEGELPRVQLRDHARILGFLRAVIGNVANDAEGEPGAGSGSGRLAPRAGGTGGQERQR